MGCGLRKLKQAQDSSPGKIYSTLKRPQVETKVGVAYTYRFLDFLIGKDDGTSTLRLSSVRELPAQLQALYQQGFVLAAVHPFIHPCGPGSNSPQHQLYRAVLLRLNDGPDKSQPPGAPHRLQLEECLSADQLPTPELIQGYVKKQIQDAADQGVTFVGFIQEPYGAPCTRIRQPETPSLSLHSSPSSVLGSLGSRSPSSARNQEGPGSLDIQSHGDQSPTHEAGDGLPGEDGDQAGKAGESDRDGTSSLAISPSTEGDLESNGELMEEDSLMHNNNKAKNIEMKPRPRYLTRRGDGVELLALFNHPTAREAQVRYFTVKVPLRVQQRDEGVKGVEANWLDHMTQHFNNGASLVDGYFHLGKDNDLLPKSVESIFIFQEPAESEPSSNAPTYDAIVVEQWTVIDGLQVKTDYVPLLQSLAMYGWRLTCVLPTPVIQTNSDGSLSTKQIVFLQRPVLARKRREAKKLIFKTRSKSNKNSVKDAPKKKKKNQAAGRDKALEDPKTVDNGENAVKEEGKTNGDGPKSQMESVCEEGGTTAEREEVTEEEVRLEEVESRAQMLGVAEKDNEGEENTSVVHGKIDKDPEKERKENGENLEDGEGEDGDDKVSEPETKTTEDKELKEVKVIIENGFDKNKESDVNGGSVISEKVVKQQITPKQERPSNQEIHKDTIPSTNQNPEETPVSED